MNNPNIINMIHFGEIFVSKYGSHIIIGLIICTLILVTMSIRTNRKTLKQRTGVEGKIIYADRGQKGGYFINHKFGILARPDFIVKEPGGEIAVLEYKSRKNGKLYKSDIVQVKASVIAVRGKIKATKAYVISGEKPHEIDVSGSSESIFNEIKKEYLHAKAANNGEIIMVFNKNLHQCKTCSQRFACLKNK